MVATKWKYLNLESGCSTFFYIELASLPSKKSGESVRVIETNKSKRYVCIYKSKVKVVCR